MCLGIPARRNAYKGLKPFPTALRVDILPILPKQIQHIPPFFCQPSPPLAPNAGMNTHDKAEKTTPTP